ncbi:MAG: hypothetical protein M9928_13965 [Anaerolineae bacterium]|nr:hypothetical protein [Anaerolineae bacterium]
MNDIELLRRFEPVIHYTEGELFFPCGVEGYVKRCSLWSRDAQGNETMLMPPGTMTTQVLAELGTAASSQSLFLRFVENSLDPIELQEWRKRPDRPIFNSVGRLSRVGLLARLVQAFYDISLLLRGRVPVGTTAAAEIQYRQITAAHPEPVYYGRVVHDSGYIILHYLFFYAMNDWRSSFYGVNDHESDWEQVFVYVTENEGEYEPQWVAFAAHDFSGDDLRRRWDDPELQIHDNTHPVVFAGAGSHASYVLPGEYLMEIELRQLSWLNRLLQPIRRFFARNLTLDETPTENSAEKPLLTFAFVDYARGDGVGIGPDQSQTWNPQLLSDEMGWVSGYRGLWGLDTHDPLGGERAPAGPKFNRDGTVRQSWYDPLGWSGLDKVPPPAQLIAHTESTIANMSAEAESLRTEIAKQRSELITTGQLTQALQATPGMTTRYKVQHDVVQAQEDAIKALMAQHAQLQEDQRALQSYLDRLKRGDKGDPQAHLQHKAIPEPPATKSARLLDIWAALSGGFVVIAFVILLYVDAQRWLFWTVAIVLIYGLIESAMRRKLINYLLIASFLLATISLVIVLINNWFLIIPAALLLIFAFSLLTNVRELRVRRNSHSGQTTAGANE